MKTKPSTCAPFTISGTGVAVGFFHYFSPSKTGQVTPQTKHCGKVRRILIRQDAGGGATAVTAYVIHRSRPPVTPSTIPDEFVIIETASLTPTASATVAFFDSPVTAEPTFQDSCCLVLDVTAGAGAWTFVGFVEMDS
jgi:hypothetical protein